MKRFSETFHYQKLSEYEGLFGKIPVRAGTTFVGVELEIEKPKTEGQFSSFVNIEEDGSLKLDGMEVVSKPIHFSFLEVELRRIFSNIKECLLSSRCSVHVHLNVRDFNTEELEKFILLYMMYEKHLFEFSGGRWNNLFCIPLSMNIPIVAQSISGLEVDSIDVMHALWSKYFSLNLLPIFGKADEGVRSYGTAEFRHMKGTTDVELIINWINLIVSLKITAKRIEKDVLIKRLRAMNTDSSYTLFTMDVFKAWAPLILEQPKFKDWVEHGILSAKTALYLAGKFPDARSTELVSF